jgi:hypothetical protein
MRAKVASVVLVACGVLGAVAVSTPSAYASRGDGDGGGGHDNGQQGNTYNHACTSNDRAVIGNVCVIVDDLPILGNVLAS